MNKNMKNMITVCILLLSVIGIVYSGYNIYKILAEYKQAENQYEDIQQEFTSVPEEPIENEPVSKINRVIDFDSLNEINPDIIGWICLEGTKIDYPILQSYDNDDYLYSTYNKTKNSSGSIFVDCRNNGLLNDNNTIIHGHNMKNGSMFKTLNSYIEKDFFDSHRVFQIFKENGTAAEYEIISVYTDDVNTTNAYYLEDGTVSYEDWLQNVCKKSIHNAADYDVTKKTVTLSTCRGSAGTNVRMIVHLQEKED